jgi:hypothetical protein
MLQRYLGRIQKWLSCYAGGQSSSLAVVVLGVPASAWSYVLLDTPPRRFIAESANEPLCRRRLPVRER